MSKEFEMAEIFNQNKELIQHYESLINVVRKLEGTVEAHIGRRGNNNQVHSLATFEMDGFLSHEDKQTIDFKGRYAQTIANDDPAKKQDVLKLGIGLYIGRYFTNLPPEIDDSLKIISVTGASQGTYKVIKVYWLTANKEYTRMIYSSIDSGWYSSEFENVALKNGYTGKLLVRRERLHTLTSVEIIFELTRAEGIASLPFATLGAGFSNTSATPIVGTAFGTIEGSNLTSPLTFILGSNSDLVLYRQKQDESYTKATGHLIFYR